MYEKVLDKIKSIKTKNDRKYLLFEYDIKEIYGKSEDFNDFLFKPKQLASFFNRFAFLFHKLLVKFHANCLGLTVYD